MVEVLVSLKGSVDSLNAQVSQGIYAYTSISEHNRQQERIDNIQFDATMQ
jgi:hypothetical protein